MLQWSTSILCENNFFFIVYSYRLRLKNEVLRFLKSNCCISRKRSAYFLLDNFLFYFPKTLRPNSRHYHEIVSLESGIILMDMKREIVCTICRWASKGNGGKTETRTKERVEAIILSLYIKRRWVFPFLFVLESLACYAINDEITHKNNWPA